MREILGVFFGGSGNGLVETDTRRKAKALIGSIIPLVLAQCLQVGHRRNVQSGHGHNPLVHVLSKVSPLATFVLGARPMLAPSAQLVGWDTVFKGAKPVVNHLYPMQPTYLPKEPT